MPILIICVIDVCFHFVLAKFVGSNGDLPRHFGHRPNSLVTTMYYEALLGIAQSCLIRFDDS